MAETITKAEEVVGYLNGNKQTLDYLRLGYYNGKPAVLRYKFKAPKEGASIVNIEKRSLNLLGGSSDDKIMLFITTNGDSHIGACYVNGATNNPEFDTVCNISKGDNSNYTEYVISSSVEKILLPDTEYYLFLFPAHKNVSFYEIYGSIYITMTFEGAAGLAQIDTGNELITAIPYIDNGTEWQQAIHYIDNGNTWNICG